MTPITIAIFIETVKFKVVTRSRGFQVRYQLSSGSFGESTGKHTMGELHQKIPMNYCCEHMTRYQKIFGRMPHVPIYCGDKCFFVKALEKCTGKKSFR